MNKTENNSRETCPFLSSMYVSRSRVEAVALTAREEPGPAVVLLARWIPRKHGCLTEQGINIQNCWLRETSSITQGFRKLPSTPTTPCRIQLLRVHPRPLPFESAMFSRQVFRTVRAAGPQRAVTLRATPVRSFAAAAADNTQPPIAVFGLDGTYASALVRLN